MKHEYWVERREDVVLPKKCKVREVWNESQTKWRKLYRGNFRQDEQTYGWRTFYERSFDSPEIAKLWLAEHGRPGDDYRIVVTYPVTIKPALHRVDLK